MFCSAVEQTYKTLTPELRKALPSLWPDLDSAAPASDPLPASASSAAPSSFAKRIEEMANAEFDQMLSSDLFQSMIRSGYRAMTKRLLAYHKAVQTEQFLAIGAVIRREQAAVQCESAQRLSDGSSSISVEQPFIAAVNERLRVWQRQIRSRTNRVRKPAPEILSAVWCGVATLLASVCSLHLLLRT